MELRSITFRCTDKQLSRMEKAMRERKNHNRTALISLALEEFLDFAERKDVKDQDLFSLVERVDALDPRHPFRKEA